MMQEKNLFFLKKNEIYFSCWFVSKTNMYFDGPGKKQRKSYFLPQPQNVLNGTNNITRPASRSGCPSHRIDQVVRPEIKRNKKRNKKILLDKAQ